MKILKHSKELLLNVNLHPIILKLLQYKSDTFSKKLLLFFKLPRFSMTYNLSMWCAAISKLASFRQNWVILVFSRFQKLGSNKTWLDEIVNSKCLSFFLKDTEIKTLLLRNLSLMKDCVMNGTFEPFKAEMFRKSGWSLFCCVHTSLLSCWLTFAASSEFFCRFLISICSRSISWASSTSLWRVFSRDIDRISSPRRLQKRNQKLILLANKLDCIFLSFIHDYPRC